MLSIYYLRISDFEAYETDLLFPRVSQETREVVLNCKSKKVQRTKLLGEAMVRYLLWELWGVKSQEYLIRKGKHGKPYVEGTGLSVYFNLSHSGNYIVAAFSDQEIGVDIEQVAGMRLEIARRFFHPAEIGRLECLTEELQRDLFFSYWSVKESYLKYTGSGLTMPLSGFEVCFTGNEIWIKKEHSRLAVSVRECLIDKDYKCFICSASNEIPQISNFRGFVNEL